MSSINLQAPFSWIYNSDTPAIPIKNHTGIQEIPPELLSAIFEEGQKSEQEGDEEGQSERIDAPPFEVVVSHISSHFRHVAIGNPMLWSSISINAASLSDRLKTYLERSTSTPLDLRIDVGWECVYSPQKARDLMNVVAMVLPHSGRWSRLSINSARESAQTPIIHAMCNRPIPILEYLSISVDDVENFDADVCRRSGEPSIFMHGAPRLSFLRLRGLAVYQFQPPLAALTVLHLDITRPIPIRYSAFEAIVTASPNLTHLSIYGDIIGGNPWPGQSNPIHLPALRSLRICGIAGNLYSGLLLTLNSPDLESLVLKDLQECDLRLLLPNPAHHMPRFARLKSLTICNSELSNTLYKDLFLMFPSITSFHTLYSSIGESQLSRLLEIEDSGKAGILGWPQLQSMTFVFDFRDDEEFVNDMLANCKENGRHLSELRFATSQKEEFANWSNNLEADENLAIVMMKNLDKWPEFAMHSQQFLDLDDDLFLV